MVDFPLEYSIPVDVVSGDLLVDPSLVIQSCWFTSEIEGPEKPKDNHQPVDPHTRMAPCDVAPKGGRTVESLCATGPQRVPSAPQQYTHS